MRSFEQPHTPRFEGEPRSYGAAQFHADLTTLLLTKGEPCDDGYYYTLFIDEHDSEVAVISNYMTHVVHRSYGRHAGTQPEQTVIQSLLHSNAVFDIQFNHATADFNVTENSSATTYSCFKSSDIIPEKSGWLQLDADELLALQEQEYVVVGPEGVVDLETDNFMQFIARWVSAEAKAA